MFAVLFFTSLIIISYNTFSILIAKNETLEIGRSSFFAVASGSLIAIFYATALAILGIYSLLLLDICLLLTGGAGLIYLKNSNVLLSLKALVGHLKGYKWNLLVIGIILIGAFLYFAFPTKYLMGGRDQGLYVINGINISRNGTMQLQEDQFLSENYDLIKDTVRRGYPGIYSAYDRGLSEKQGDLIPQFLPMFPAALAIGYDLFGIEGLIRVNCVIGLLALLSIYYFTRKVFGNIPALLSLIFMTINPSQLWNARITQTELLCQLLFFLSMFIFVNAWQKDNVKLSVLSGLLIGIGGFCRVDTYIWGLAVFAVFIYVTLFRQNKLKITSHLVATTTVLFLFSYLYGFSFSRPYYHDLWAGGSLKGIILLNICFAIVALVCFIFSKIALKKEPTKNFILHVIDHPLGGLWVLRVLFFIFIFAYFLRPLLAIIIRTEYFNAHAMIEFCWYTSFIAMPIAIFSVYSILQKRFLFREELFLFLLIGLSSMFGYIYRPSISPDHIWTSRRWITVNIPFIIVLASYGVYTIYVLLKPKIGKLSILAICVCSLWIFVYTGFHSLPFLTKTMLKDIDKQYAAAIQSMDKDAVYLADEGQFPGIMKYVYGLNIFYSGKDLSNLSEYLRSEEKDVYMITEKKPFSFTVDYIPVSEFKIGGDFLERTIASYPKTTFDWSYDLYLYKIAAKDSATVQTTYSLDPLIYFNHENRQDKANVCISSGEAGFLVYGPYTTLPKGTYKLTMDISLQAYSQDDAGYIDVAANSGNTVIKEDLSSEKLRLNGTDSINLEFNLQSKTSYVEFRLYTAEGTVMQLDNVLLTPIAIDFDN